jgi:hypothetical protein
MREYFDHFMGCVRNSEECEKKNSSLFGIKEGAYSLARRVLILGKGKNKF